MEEIKDVQWDLFKSSVVDKSTTSQQWVEYKEDNVNLSANQQNFRISTKDLDAFLVPSEGALELRIKVTEDGGDDPDANTQATIVNDVLHIFRSCEYKVNEKLVERLDYAGLCSEMKHLAMDDPTYSEKQGQMSLYYQDVDGGVNATGSLGEASGQFPTNDGFSARAERSSRGTMNLFVPLRHIFGSHMEKKAVRGVRHTYEFARENSLGEVIHRSDRRGDAEAQTDGAFEILDMSIWMPLVKPSVDTLKDLEQDLASGAVATRIFHEWTGYRSAVFNGDTQPVWRITTSSKKPIMVFVCAQLQQRLSLQRLNAGKFDHLRTSRAELRVNSKVIPEQTYDLDFPSDRYTRLYYDWLTSTGRHTGDEGSNVDYDDFKNIYTVWAFDLSAQEHLYQNVKTNDIEVRLNCDSAGYVANLAVGGGALGTVRDNDGGAGAVDTPLNANYYLNAVIVSEREMRIEGKSGRVSVAV